MSKWKSTKKRPVADRFWEKVDVRGPDECWLWQAGRDPYGYGRLNVGGRPICTHRISFEIHTGEPIPDGMCVLHRCDNPPCVNHRHLFLGSKADNNADMRAKGRGAFGSANGKAKLTEPDVCEIRVLYDAGGVSQRELGDCFGVSSSLIGSIVRGERWTHLDQNETSLNPVSTRVG